MGSSSFLGEALELSMPPSFLRSSSFFLSCSLWSDMRRATPALDGDEEETGERAASGMRRAGRKPPETTPKQLANAASDRHTAAIRPCAAAFILRTQAVRVLFPLLGGF